VATCWHSKPPNPRTGIKAPKPLQLRMHVLVMEFIGEDGVAAPRLKDAGLPPHQMRAAYLDMVLLTRKLFQECRLVHADLSEYNILYHQVRGAQGW
jgi:RIO kinase 1